MIRFAALNESLREDSHPEAGKTKEAEESAGLQLYQSALALQQSGKHDQAETAYKELLNASLVTKAQTVGRVELQHVPVGIRLKYLALKNIAAIAVASGDLEKAISFYVQAAAIDPSDVVLWYHLGRTAVRCKRLLLARHAFEQALLLDSDYWPCLDALCTVLFALDDLSGCLSVALDALDKDEAFEKGIVYLNHLHAKESWLPQWQLLTPKIFVFLQADVSNEVSDRYIREVSELREGYFKRIDANPQLVAKPQLHLSGLSWLSLGKDLLDLHKIMKLSTDAMPLSARVDISDAIASAMSAESTGTGRKWTSSPISTISNRSSPTTIASSSDVKTAVRRGMKRKQPLSEQQEVSSGPCTPKRRSARVRTGGKKERAAGHSCAEMLQTFMPAVFRSAASSSATKTPSPMRQSYSPQSTSPLARRLFTAEQPSSQDAEEISDFLCHHVENGGVIDLMINFVCHLAMKKRSKSWPSPLVDIYRQIYFVVRPSWPTVTPSDREEDLPWTRSSAWARLIAIELQFDARKSPAPELVARSRHSSSALITDLISGTFGDDLQHVIAATAQPTLMGREFSVRVFWLKGHLSLRLGQRSAAQTFFLKALRILQQHVQDSLLSPQQEGISAITVHNCCHDCRISSVLIKEKIETIQRSKTFEEVQENFTAGKHQLVLATLAPLLQEPPLTTPKMTVETVKDIPDRTKQLLILQDAYWQLGQIEECLRCAEIILNEVLQLVEVFEPWRSTLCSLLETLLRCVKRPEGSPTCLPLHQQERLWSSLVQTIDLVMENTDLCGDLLPAPLPWVVLYHILRHLSPSSTKSSPFLRGSTQGLSTSVTPSPPNMQCPPSLTLQQVKSAEHGALEQGATDQHRPEEVTDTSSFPGPDQASLDQGEEQVSQRVKFVREEKPDMFVDSSSTQHTSQGDDCVDSEILPPTCISAEQSHELGPSKRSCKLGHSAVADNEHEDCVKQDLKDSSAKPDQPDQLSSEETPVPPHQTAALRENDVVSCKSSRHESSLQTSPSPSDARTCKGSVPPVTSFQPKAAPPVGSVGRADSPSMFGGASHISFLQAAHTALGRHGLCCASDGVLLLLMAKDIKRLLSAGVLHASLRQELLHELEQCYFCLYGHPNKKAKARRLQDHGSTQVELNWSQAVNVFEFFCPRVQPTFDSTKLGITAELLNLFRRAVGLLPKSIQPVVSMEDLTAFVEGSVPSLSSDGAAVKRQTVVCEIFHLLADYHLKSGEYIKAIKLYMQDLCFNPDRFDSWAGLALARHKRLDDKINLLEGKHEVGRFVQRYSGPALKCFERARHLNDSGCSLAEQHGLLAHTLQSYASQLLKQGCGDAELQSFMEGLQKSMLSLAKTCFLRCLEYRGEEIDTWLHYLLLGKICEKVAEPLEVALQHYLEAMEFLESRGTTFPKRITFKSPDVVIGALEVFYRVHCSVIKHAARGNISHPGKVESYLDKITKLAFGHSRIPQVMSPVKSGISCMSEKNVGSPRSSADGRQVDQPVSESSHPSVTSLDTDRIYCKEQGEASASCEAETVRTVVTQAESSSPQVVADSENVQQEDLIGNEERVKVMKDSEKTQEEGGESTEPKEEEMAKGSCSEEAISSPGSRKLVASSGERSDADFSTVLIDRCICALSVCIQRFQHHHRATYRLAHTYAHVPSHQDLVKSCSFLLPSSSGLPDKSEAHVPLFRFKAGFFQFWKNPVEELERPGSFVAHISRSLGLLRHVLFELKDTASLLSVCHFLFKKPEQAKKFLRDADRLLWARKMFSSLTDLLHAQVQEEVSQLLDAGEDGETKQILEDSLSKLLIVLFELAHIRAFAQKVAENTSALNKIFLLAGRPLAPWLFPGMDLAKLKSLDQGDLIRAAVEFCQQHLTGTLQTSGSASTISVSAAGKIDQGHKTLVVESAITYMRNVEVLSHNVTALRHLAHPSTQSKEDNTDHCTDSTAEITSEQGSRVTSPTSTVSQPTSDMDAEPSTPVEDTDELHARRGLSGCKLRLSSSGEDTKESTQALDTAPKSSVTDGEPESMDVDGQGAEAAGEDVLSGGELSAGTEVFEEESISEAEMETADESTTYNLLEGEGNVFVHSKNSH